MLKKSVKNLFILFIAVIVSLFIAEVVLRLMGAPSRGLEFEPGREPGSYFMKPNQEFIEKTYEYQPSHKIRINSQGFRDNEIEYKDGYKIFCLGDSFTYGAGVNLEDTFVDRLEKSLRKLKPDFGFEVINAGSGGATIDDELIFFKEKGLKPKPQMLIFQFYENDVLDFYNKEKNREIYKPAKLPFKDLLRRTALYIKLYKLKTYLLTRKVNDELNCMQNGSSKRDDFYTLPLCPFWQKAWSDYLAGLQKLADICKNHDIKLVLLVIPSVDQAEDESKADIVQRKLEGFAKKNKAIFIDPLAALRAQGTENVYLEFDKHLNVRGHKVVADCLLKELRNESVIDLKDLLPRAATPPGVS